MTRRIPHTSSKTEVRQAFQRLSADLGTIEASAGELTAEANETVVDGQPLYKVAGLTKVGIARADAAAKSRVCGLAVRAASIGHAATYVTSGQLTLSDWTDVLGAVTLTSGSIYYLNDAGGLTATAPTVPGKYVTEIGQAVSTVTLDLHLKRPILL